MEKNILYYKTCPYTYILKSGEIQKVEATISVTEREYRRRWFEWTRLFNKIVKSIQIDFSDEVGEKTGSWKGGTIGCSFEMLPNETATECLKRMELTRKF